MSSLNHRHHENLRQAENTRVKQCNNRNLWIIVLIAISVLSISLAASTMVTNYDLRKGSKSGTIAKLMTEKANVEMELDEERRLHRETAEQLNELRANIAGGFPTNF